MDVYVEKVNEGYETPQKWKSQHIEDQAAEISRAAVFCAVNVIVDKANEFT